ncbi:MAG: hypothetical protein OEW58_12575 [Gammaproteobacteria bacterium]|nr:hypothetical protein [Gammaproteobacteria bacterium]
MFLHHHWTRPLVASLFIFSLHTNALATPINITFADSGQSFGQYSQINLSNDPIDLTITSHTHDGSSSQVFLDQDGLGVKLSKGSDGSEIDNLGPDESLRLLFGTDVKLITATFSQIGLNDDFIVRTLNNVINSSFIAGNINDNGIQTVLFPSLTGKEFYFSNNGAHSEYSLKSISFEPIAVSAPTPLMLLVGLLLAACKRRRIR